MSILIVEDEEAIRKLLKLCLSEAGYAVRMAKDGEEAMEAVRCHLPDLVILDWMLPEIDGMDVLQSLRKNASSRDIPVIMLTARAGERDRVQGLDYGADDYISKPFSPKELVARVRALLRRSGKAGKGAEEKEKSPMLFHGDIALDTVERRVTRAGNSVHLAPIEFRLLIYFMRSPGRVYSREQLLDNVWGHEHYVDERTVDVHIRRLRKALNAHGKDVIRTVRSMGYALKKSI